VGKAVAKAYGSSPCRGKYHLGAFDAFHPHHLPLPRAVGPYTVIRATQIISTPRTLQLFGSFMADGGVSTAGGWTLRCAVGGVDGNLPINAATNAQFSTSALTTNGLGGLGAQLVPSAVSVQIMNPNALQTTSGIVYIGRAENVMKLADDTRTWNTLGSQLVSYYSPRLCSAAKLAMRGVHVDCKPMNMSALSNFSEINTLLGAGANAWDELQGELTGFAPVFVYNPNAINLQYLVSTEYRVRFDPGNPACAAHIQHPVAKDETWGELISSMASGASAAKDIAEVVSMMGRAASTVGSFL